MNKYKDKNILFPSIVDCNKNTNIAEELGKGGEG